MGMWRSGRIEAFETTQKMKLNCLDVTVVD